MVDNFSLPVAYALMETKTATSYDQVIVFIKNNILPNFRPTSIMTDFEPALRDTLTSYFNTAQPYGYWFHHNQVVWKSMKRFCYLELVKSNDKAKKCLRMVMALPLLPSHKI
ncbi:unnamed protein product [Macrosiphum euphorbiae]|uniref:MULE transposase domain-containing protein n=1 Tax=Macrosiphum euphorbiae TaxID=13131 RepID=A0AAV0XMW7_9HEMI|nr:unnamed protein product [Macrosiphum euphorbiae]